MAREVHSLQLCISCLTAVYLVPAWIGRVREEDKLISRPWTNKATKLDDR
jgi:hypothetical protein